MMNKINYESYLNSLTVEEVLLLFTAESEKSHDGHFSIFSFTTNFKAAFGTPQNIQESCSKMEAYPTLKLALVYALVESLSFSTIEKQND